MYQPNILLPNKLSSALSPHVPTSGKMLLVHALCDLKAGDEVTTVYSADRELLKDHWGIDED